MEQLYLNMQFKEMQLFKITVFGFKINKLLKRHIKVQRKLYKNIS